ncbi:hypothetical protein LTSEBAI_5230, partial [Salmonella enterica subsp. enterica serovar Baildon str. R6-199]
MWALCPQFSGIEGSSIRPARAPAALTHRSKS